MCARARPRELGRVDPDAVTTECVVYVRLDRSRTEGERDGSRYMLWPSIYRGSYAAVFRMDSHMQQVIVWTRLSNEKVPERKQQNSMELLANFICMYVC